MTPSELKRVEIAADVLHGSVRSVRVELFCITAEIASSSGHVLETAGFGEAIDVLCGGPDRNRIIDSVSGRRALIVGAQDTTTGALLCRLCHLERRDRMTERFTLLGANELHGAVPVRGQVRCECGRMLT